MRSRSILINLILLVFCIKTYCQEQAYPLSINISVNESVQKSFHSNGRLYVYLITNPNMEPRNQGVDGFSGRDILFAKNISHWNSSDILSITGTEDWDMWSKEVKCGFEIIPEGTYFLQILWDQNMDDFGINAPGNIFSKKLELNLTSPRNVNISLSEVIEPPILLEHELLKLVVHQSDTISKWQGNPVYERAAVLLPSGYYKNKKKEYPIRYRILGGHGSLIRSVNSLLNDSTFFNWWITDEAPQIINVFLDGEINGNIYHVDSDNIGPFGYSLVNEFIPFIEDLYRGTDTPITRFVDGCSTGGWGSLALQLFYPETFNGVFSYSPDPITFENFLSLNIYENDNIFINKYGYEIPLMRTSNGDTRVSFRHWIEFNNITSISGLYTDSDDYFGIWSRLFSKKGSDGKPEKLFDPYTGIIDPNVAASWKRYDLMHYLLENWQLLAPKLKGKVYIWAGTNDYVFSDRHVIQFRDMISTMKNPTLDAIIEIEPGASHCEQYSNRRILEQISQKLNDINRE